MDLAHSKLIDWCIYLDFLINRSKVMINSVFLCCDFNTKNSAKTKNTFFVGQTFKILSREQIFIKWPSQIVSLLWNRFWKGQEKILMKLVWRISYNFLKLKMFSLQRMLWVPYIRFILYYPYFFILGPKCQNMEIHPQSPNFGIF